MIWKIIENYQNYEISTTGIVRNINTKKELKPYIVDGYLRVRLYNDIGCKCYYIHRLVADAFLLNLQNKQQIDHIDKNRNNNNVNNLRWVSAKENVCRTKGKVGAYIGIYKKNTRVRVIYKQNNITLTKTWSIENYLEAEQFYFEKCGEFEWI